jgi:hypothetical protein
MGKTCTIQKESCGFKCTSYDGSISKDVTIKKGSNAWDGLRKVVKEGVWCESCAEDGLRKINGLQDIVNLGIGEKKKPHDAENLKQFVNEVNCAYRTCKERGDCI